VNSNNVFNFFKNKQMHKEKLEYLDLEKDKSKFEVSIFLKIAILITVLIVIGVIIFAIIIDN